MIPTSRCSSTELMRRAGRRCLPQLHEVFAGRDQRNLRLLDIGCGTGRFLDFLKQAWPRFPVLGLDMSEPYVRSAKRHLKRWSRINLIVGNAEALPVPDESQEPPGLVCWVERDPARPGGVQGSTHGFWRVRRCSGAWLSRGFGSVVAVVAMKSARLRALPDAKPCG
jgi:SAM-dependent methyltransferase